MASDPRRWKALAVLGIAYLMVILDVSIVNVALPQIQEDLDFAPENLQWVISGYALTFGGFLLLGGRAGDISAPPAPCTVRAAMSVPRCSETPPTNEAAAKSTAPAMKTLRRPSRSASLPPKSRKPPKVSA